MNENNGQVTVNEVWSIVESGQPIHMIDVREPAEFATGHAPGARNLPLGDVGHELPGIGKDEPVALICQGGVRSEAARQRLMGHHTNLVNVIGGTSAWIAAGLPIE